MYGPKPSKKPIVLFESDYGGMVITLREVISSILVIGVMSFVGSLISDRIGKSMEDSLHVYRQAAVLNGNDEFSHAMRTDVGNAFAEGEFHTVDPVTYENLKGEHLSIVADFQHYTHHTRVVTYTVKVGKSTQVRTRIEHYWTWDTVRVDRRMAKKVNYCGSEFDYGKFSYSCVGSKWHTHSLGFHDRVVFSYKPKDFNASVFTDFRNNTVSDDTVLYEDMTKESLRESKMDMFHWVGFFWTLWVMLIIGVVVLYYHAENNWLEDEA